MKPIFYLFFIALLLSSCKKERTIHITARNAVTGAPYSGLKYYVVQEMTSGDGEKFKTVIEGNLNEYGEAIITKKLPKSYSYAVRVEEPTNTCYNKKITYYFGTEDKFECPFEFAECAYLKLQIHNVNCIDSNDEIKFRRLWLSTNESNNFVIQTGCFQFDGNYFSLPMGQYKYEWIVTKNGITTVHDSIFTLSANQYFDFAINY
ncbi:MAG: hypothetical protein IT221_00015 [Fluviicola sp.]|nr:hypothetical protein [Fluviicola sp.]